MKFIKKIKESVVLGMIMNEDGDEVKKYHFLEFIFILSDNRLQLFRCCHIFALLHNILKNIPEAHLSLKRYQLHFPKFKEKARNNCIIGKKVW